MSVGRIIQAIMKVSPGQIVMRPKLDGISGWHSGVALSENAIFHNTIDSGAHLGTLREFSAGQPVWVFPSTVRSQADYEALLSRARAVEGEPYSAYYFNCEDAASEVRYGIPRTPTREKIVWAGLAAIGLVWIASVLSDN